MACPEGWVFTLLVVMGFTALWVKWRWPPRGRPSSPLQAFSAPAQTAHPRRLLRVSHHPPTHLPPASTPLKPYSQVKSLPGPLRVKRIGPAGYACPNSDGLYYGITDEQIHALVGYGGHESMTRLS
jgi:hypothetical protein